MGVPWIAVKNCSTKCIQNDNLFINYNRFFFHLEHNWDILANEPQKHNTKAFHLHAKNMPHRDCIIQQCSTIWKLPNGNHWSLMEFIEQISILFPCSMLHMLTWFFINLYQPQPHTIMIIIIFNIYFIDSAVGSMIIIIGIYFPLRLLFCSTKFTILFI